MFNYMLDRFPSDYEGFLIRTDFRVGIQIIQCLNDPDFSKEEKIGTALELLYGYGCPVDIEVAVNGLKWFMSCGKESKGNDDTSDPVYDYDYDSALLYSAFKKTFNIDLSTTKLHWWQFVALMSDLDNCAFSKTIEIRMKKIVANMSPEEKEYYRKAKERCQLPVKISMEEQRKIDEFMKKAKGGVN